MSYFRACTLAFSVLLACASLGAAGTTQLSFENGLPAYLQDRGKGVPLSMFGTYIEKGQWIVYPFYEYYWDHNAEYSPNELGFGLDEDFLAKSQAHEGLIFIGYGVSRRVAVELEVAVIREALQKASNDPTTRPREIRESGLGDTEGQIRWRWAEENAARPELFSYFETVFPLQKNRVLIGTQDWEFKLGFGAVKGYGFGTLTGRLAVEYDRSEDKTEAGEMAVEYLKKLSSTWRVFTAFEGTFDEIELITELQWHVSKNAFIKINNAFGVTPKAADYAPELGVAFVF